MEDSDNLIFLTLKQTTSNVKVDSVNKITAEDLKSIVLQLFKFLGVDIKPFQSIEPSQKYRVANKIVDELKKQFAIQIDFMLLINPNPSETRKLLISLISKISSMDSSKGYEPTTLSYEEKNESDRVKQNINVLKSWKNDEWILPELIEYKPRLHKFQGLSLNSANLRSEFITLRMHKSDYGSLFATCSGELARWKQEQEEKEKERELRHQLENKENRSRLILENNKDSWSLNFKKTTKDTINDLIMSLDQEEQTKQELTQEPTLYALELQYKQEDQSSESEKEEDEEQSTKKGLEFDLEKIRSQHRAELEKITQALSEKQRNVVSLEEKINNIEEQKQRMEDELQELKDENINIQNSTETLHELVTALENPEKSEKELAELVSKLETDIADMKDEWKQHRTKVMGKIEKYKSTIEENREKLEEIKSKLKFVETDYDSLIQKIKTNYELKAHLQNELVNLPKEVSRNVFVKRINEINVSYIKQKSELNKILGDVQNLQKAVDYNTSLCERYCTEIENTLKSDPKPDSLSKAILKIYQDYNSTFQQTIKNLQDQGKNKLEGRDLERKIEFLQGKGYNNMISKLQTDLNVLKEENNKMVYQYQSQYQS